MRLRTTTSETPRRALWPDAVAFREAIQNPGAVLGDPELQSAGVVLDRRGLPLAYSGRFAVVFRLRAQSGDWAVRCFTQAANDRERRERYRAIADRLAESHAAHFVPFRYIERGIRIGTEWFPVVAMRWAEGETLGRWVEANLHRPDALRRLAATLGALLEDLEAAGIAHGDWQHDNLLVSGDGAQITLVDYDGMFVPGLAGRPSLEIGHPNYQHPARTAGDYALGLDRFSCLALQTALLALARDASLWDRFNDGESILFKRADFADPSRSPVFGALRSLAGESAALGAFLTRLERACFSGPEGVFAAPEALDPGAESGDVGDAARWWLSAETVAPAKRSPARQTALPGPAAGEYLRRLTGEEAERAEKNSLSSARIIAVSAVLASAAWFLQILDFAPFWLIGLLWYVVFGPAYNGWPRKQVHDELLAEIRKRDDLIWKRRGAIAARWETEQLEREIEDLEGQRRGLEQQRERENFPLSYHLAVDISRLDQLLENSKARLAAERSGLSRHPLVGVPDARGLEREIWALEADREALLREREDFPDTSIRAYCRKLLGLKDAP